MEIVLWLWVTGFVFCFLICTPWIYKSFTRGGAEDGFGILLLVFLLSLVFAPLTIIGVFLSGWDKIRGKKV